MTIEIGILLSILTFGMSVLVNVLNQKKTNKQESEKLGYANGKLDEKLNSIEKTLDKIEKKLDKYDIELDERIEKAIQVHCREYHNLQK